MVLTLALVVSAGHADISAPTSNMVVQQLERAQAHSEQLFTEPQCAHD